MTNNANLSTYMKPKKRIFKIILLSVVVIILGIGLWVGLTAFNTFKKITAFSKGNNSIFSFLGDLDKTKLKGESEGRTNILLLGMGGKNHPGGTLSDTIIVLSIDWQTKQAAFLSIPRDLWVQIPDYGWAKINNAFAHGETNQKTTGGGGQVASETVSKILDIPIHYFVSVDFEGFKKIVDTVGGVDIYVEKDIYDPYYPAANMIDYDPFKIQAGQYHMDGTLALKYARSRETTSDFDRSKRQQIVLSAVKEKVLSLQILSNPKKVTDLLNILGDHLRTNLSINEIKSLWDTIKDIDTAKVINKVLDTSEGGPLTATQDQRGYIIIPRKGIGNYTDLQKIAKNIFATSSESATNDLEIEVLNGSGKSGRAADLADQLKSEGYNVAKIGDATKIYENSIVYNCSGKVAETIVKEIAEMIDATSNTKTSCGTIDIQVIVGENYLPTR